MDLKVTTRTETLQLLNDWLAGKISPREVWGWASEVKAAQYQPEDELVRDVIDVLEQLPADLIILEDAEVMVYALNNPPEEADLGQNLLWNHLDGIDADARRRSLADDEFYGPFCGDVM